MHLFLFLMLFGLMLRAENTVLVIEVGEDPKGPFSNPPTLPVEPLPLDLLEAHDSLKEALSAASIPAETALDRAIKSTSEIIDPQAKYDVGESSEFSTFYNRNDFKSKQENTGAFYMGMTPEQQRMYIRQSPDSDLRNQITYGPQGLPKSNFSLQRYDPLK